MVFQVDGFAARIGSDGGVYHLLRFRPRESSEDAGIKIGVWTRSIYPCIYLSTVPTNLSIYTMLHMYDEDPESYDTPRVCDRVPEQKKRIRASVPSNPMLRP